MKISIVGTIDVTHTEVSGQYDRTEIIKDGLIREGYDVFFVNLYNYKKRPFSILIRLFRSYFLADAFLFMTSVNGTRVILKLISFLKKVKTKAIFQIAIGGWGNYSFIEEEIVYRDILKSINGIFVEVKAMRDHYIRNGITNVYYLPNCKDISMNCKYNHCRDTVTYRFCTYSRVTPIKGISEAVAAVKYLNKRYGDYFCSLDIYGTYLEEDREWFDNLKKQFTDQITYKGKISRKDSMQVLSQYDIMLFFTTHVGEGVPGAVIDCYEAGVPIVVSDISFMREIVHDGITGLVFQNGSYMNMVNRIEEYCNNMSDEDKLKMRSNCLKEACKYDTRNVISTLSKHLDML